MVSLGPFLQTAASTAKGITMGAALLRSLGFRVRNNGCLRITDPENQAIIKESFIYHIIDSWVSKPGGLAKCIVFVEAATLFEFVSTFNEYGTPNHFSAKRLTLFCTKDEEVFSYQMYFSTENINKVRQVVKVLRPSTVPKMVLFFEMIVRMFKLQKHVKDILARTSTMFNKRFRAGKVVLWTHSLLCCLPPIPQSACCFLP